MLFNNLKVVLWQSCAMTNTVWRHVCLIFSIFNPPNQVHSLIKNNNQHGNISPSCISPLAMQMKVQNRVIQSNQWVTSAWEPCCQAVQGTYKHLHHHHHHINLCVYICHGATLRVNQTSHKQQHGRRLFFQHIQSWLFFQEETQHSSCIFTRKTGRRWHLLDNKIG